MLVNDALKRLFVLNNRPVTENEPAVNFRPKDVSEVIISNPRELDVPIKSTGEKFVYKFNELRVECDNIDITYKKDARYGKVVRLDLCVGNTIVASRELNDNDTAYVFGVNNMAYFTRNFVGNYRIRDKIEWKV